MHTVYIFRYTLYIFSDTLCIYFQIQIYFLYIFRYRYISHTDIFLDTPCIYFQIHPAYIFRYTLYIFLDKNKQTTMITPPLHLPSGPQKKLFSSMIIYILFINLLSMKLKYIFFKMSDFHTLKYVYKYTFFVLFGPDLHSLSHRYHQLNASANFLKSRVLQKVFELHSQNYWVCILFYSHD